MPMQETYKRHGHQQFFVFFRLKSTCIDCCSARTFFVCACVCVLHRHRDTCSRSRSHMREREDHPHTQSVTRRRLLLLQQQRQQLSRITRSRALFSLSHPRPLTDSRALSPSLTDSLVHGNSEACSSRSRQAGNAEERERGREKIVAGISTPFDW